MWLQTPLEDLLKGRAQKRVDAETAAQVRTVHCSGKASAHATIFLRPVQPACCVSAELHSPVNITFETQRNTSPPLTCFSWAQAHLAILTGGCLALGLRFAGSQSAAAAAVIQQQLQHCLRCKALVPDANAGVPCTA